MKDPPKVVPVVFGEGERAGVHKRRSDCVGVCVCVCVCVCVRLCTVELMNADSQDFVQPIRCIARKPLLMRY